MTIIVEAPATILHIAAQFAHADPCKEAITGIHLLSTANGMRIAGTNGHFAFRCLVPFGNDCSMTNDEGMGNCDLLLPAAVFKKKVAYARKAVISDGEVRFIGGKKEEGLLEARPCLECAWSFPSHFDSLWPDPASMENAPAAPTAFNADYMRIICDMAWKWSDNGIVKMWQGNSPISAMLLSTSLDELTLQWLLLPVQLRDWS